MSEGIRDILLTEVRPGDLIRTEKRSWGCEWFAIVDVRSGEITYFWRRVDQFGDAMQWRLDRLPIAHRDDEGAFVRGEIVSRASTEGV